MDHGGYIGLGNRRAKPSPPNPAILVSTKIRRRSCQRCGSRSLWTGIEAINVLFPI